MELDAGVGRLPRGLGGEIFRHVGLRAAGLARVIKTACLEAHEIGRLDLDIAFGDRELHALVLADRPAEDDALLGIGRHLIDEPVAVADAFGRDQDALGVEAGENVLEAVAFLADQILFGDFEIVEKQFVGLVIDHVEDWPDAEAGLHRLLDVDDEDRHAL